MSERPAYLPPLPELYPRTDYRPAEPAMVESFSASAGSGVAPPTEERTAVSGLPAGIDREPQRRVELSGRLGAAPTFRTTPKGTLVAKFPLGVKNEANLNKTTWYQVLAFRAIAEQVRDSLKKGDLVEVIGYRHHRQLPGRNGPRTIEEIYGTVVKPR